MFKDITQQSAECAAILQTERCTRITMDECVFENVVSAKEDGEIMEIAQSRVDVSGASFDQHRWTPSSQVTSESEMDESGERRENGGENERERRRNWEWDGVCVCSWHHCAIVLKDVRGRMEECAFQHTSDGALSVEDASILSLSHVSFLSQLAES